MKILFGADMSFHFMGEYPGDDVAKKAMAEVTPIFKEADFSILNLENVLGDIEDYKPILKCGPNLISTENYFNYIKELNPTVVGMANNHTGDFGEEAIFNTFKVLDENGYPYIGAGANIEEAYKPYIVEKDGVKIGIIAVCENEFGGAKKDKAGSGVYSLTRLQRGIDALVADGIKPVIYFHGGNEEYPFPSPGKKELYRHFIDMGAGAVVAMHTHCPQGYETYKGAPIIYSMGNLYFPCTSQMKETYSPRYIITWHHGYLTELDFGGDEIKIKTIPYRYDKNGITLLKGEELEHFNKYLEYITSVIQDDDKLEKYFDAWCIKYCHEESDPNVYFDESLIPIDHPNVPLRRNKYTCEAHNELWENYFVVCYEKRLDESVHLIEEIERLQQIKLKD